MRIAVAADERAGIADVVVGELRRRGHEPIPHGALSDAERDDWAWASEAPARDLGGGAGRDPRRVVRSGAEHRRRGPRKRRAPRRDRTVVQRLLPDPGPTTPDAQYSGLGLVDLAHADRPYVVTNFALTLDGRATIAGRSG